MHIMHVIDGLPLGGAERMLVDIANVTVGAGDHVSVCVTRTCTDLGDSLDPSISLHVLGRTRRFDMKALRRFAVLVRERRVDLLHAHSRSTFAFLAVLKLLRWIRVPILFQDHYGSIERDESVPLWFRLAGRVFLDQYVGVCDKLGMWARKAGVPSHKIAVVGNRLNLFRLQEGPALDLHQEFGFAPGDRVGVVVAGIRYDKGTDLLLQALALSPLLPATKILIIGGDVDPGYAEQCRQLAKQLRLNDHVRFVGRRLDVPAVVKGADFALMPSRSESGPLVLIEFMMAGLPLVSTMVGDIARLAQQSGLGEFVPAGDPAAFRAALDRLLRLSPAEWSARSDVGRRIALERFDLREALPRWQELYHHILARNMA